MKKAFLGIGIFLGIFFFLFASVILYIIKTPLSSLIKYGNADWITLITAFKEYTSDISKEYGFESVDDLEIIPGAINVVYFNQGDEPWASHPFGSVGTIKTSACGPVSMSIVVSTLTNEIVDPISMSDWCVEQGYRAVEDGVGHGTSRSFINAASLKYGLTCTDIGKDPQAILTALADGQLVVVLMGKGSFTQGGHYIVLRGVTEEGKILVADCGSRKRTNMEWDLNTIVSESKDTAGGGPMWAIGGNKVEGEGLSYTLTGYCPCKICCGKWSDVKNPKTASGTTPKANHTIAADTSIYPFGTQLMINGVTYTVEDTGSAITGYHFDIYFDNHKDALKFGKQTTFDVKRIN